MAPTAPKSSKASPVCHQPSSFSFFFLVPSSLALLSCSFSLSIALLLIFFFSYGIPLSNAVSETPFLPAMTLPFPPTDERPFSRSFSVLVSSSPFIFVVYCFLFFPSCSCVDRVSLRAFTSLCSRRHWRDSSAPPCSPTLSVFPSLSNTLPAFLTAVSFLPFRPVPQS